MNTPGDFVQELLRLRRLVAAALVGKLPEASENFDRTRIDALIFDEVIRIRGLMLRLLRPPAVVAGRKPRSPARKDALEDKVLRVLGDLQAFVLQHPVAAQKVFAALVAEGRKYAATEPGAARSRILAGMPSLARARQFWESSLAGILEEGGETVLPSSYVEIVLQGGRLKSPETLLSRIPTLPGEGRQ